jgi:hypothetical protein
MSEDPLKTKYLHGLTRRGTRGPGGCTMAAPGDPGGGFLMRLKPDRTAHLNAMRARELERIPARFPGKAFALRSRSSPSVGVSGRRSSSGRLSDERARLRGQEEGTWPRRRERKAAGRPTSARLGDRRSGPSPRYDGLRPGLTAPRHYLRGERSIQTGDHHRRVFVDALLHEPRIIGCASVPRHGLRWNH